jgi:hypothetical protein
MALADRQSLVLRIRNARANGAEAWLTTSGGTTYGPMVIRRERPTVAGRVRAGNTRRLA